MLWGQRPIDWHQLPALYPPTQIQGIYRADPQAFIVEEDLGVEPSGSGEHWWLWIEKIGLTTEEVIHRLSNTWGIKPALFGYAGKKDRLAVARQWISCPIEAKPQLGGVGVGLEILAIHRDAQKIRVGQLHGNRFQIRIDAITGLEALPERLALITRSGIPNYFGPQRFGREGQTLERVRQLSQRDPEGRRRLRHNQSMLASAARGAGFNAIVAEHLDQGTLDTVQRGAVLQLPGDLREQVVCQETLLEWSARVEAREAVLTGALFGRRCLSRHAVFAMEQGIQDADPLGRWLLGIFPYEKRRALRVWPSDLDWQVIDEALTLRFTLPKGSFATAVLKEIGAIGIDDACLDQ
ncbi:MAG: tRNA pseudouridine(13) synthase TruD [Litorivicinaceae bacterium]